MKNYYLIGILLFSFNLCLSAKLRTKEAAEEIAGSFFSQSISNSQKISSVSGKIHFIPKTIDSSVQKGAEAFYVFNRGENNGFVIVAADDCAKTILGYADSGSFDYNTIPENLKYWLQMYENEINTISGSNTLQSVRTIAKSKNESGNTSGILPLLGNIKWNQSAPYNQLCPVINSTTGEKAVVGCVATGMAQVMKYYQWPAQGAGSNSYTTKTNKITLTVDFSQTTYDWANMTDTYSATSTEVQKNAVATLMYHCGVAVNMDYASTSNAYFSDMGKALMNNFNFDQNLDQWFRDYYSRDELVTKIKSELNASRPILIGGQASDGGHLFVMDGYDNNELFHINWGWGGSSNGFFQISALNPDYQSNPSLGYNTSQQFYFGIQKPNANSVPIYHINMGGAPVSTSSSITRSATTTITAANMYNYGLNTFSGNLGLALFKDGELLSVIKNYSITELKAGYGWNTFTASSVTIPAQIPNGQYKLYVVYKLNAESVWSVVRTRIGTPNYVNVNITTDNVEFSNETGAGPQLQLNSLTKTGNLYQDKSGRFSISVTNSGEEYNSIVSVFIQSVTQPEVSQNIIVKTNFVKNETKTFDLNEIITLAPGDYNMSVRYDPTNNTSSSYTMLQLGNSQAVSILPTPTGVADLELQSLAAFTNNSSVDKNNAVLSAVIKNKSGFFDNKMIAFVFLPAGGASLCYIGYQQVTIDSNEQQTVSFKGSMELTPGNYKAIIYYRNDAGSWVKVAPTGYGLVPFVLVDNSTGLFYPGKTENLDAFPNPVNGQLYFISNEITEKVELYCLDGRLIKKDYPRSSGLICVDVNCLEAGNYLLKVYTNTGSKVSKFVKR